MSTVKRGRVVRAEEAARGAPILRSGPSAAQRSRLAQEEVLAHQNADRVIDMAVTRARQIVERAEGEAKRAAEEAAAAAVESERAKLAGAWIALRQREETSATRGLDGTVALARLLAERLLGHAMQVDPQVVASLAREALAEARGARSARIEAHPLDAEALRALLVDAGAGSGEGVAVEIVADESLARGSLRVHTDLGTLDASLTPRLERLAAALRDALGPA